MAQPIKKSGASEVPKTLATPPEEERHAEITKVGPQPAAVPQGYYAGYGPRLEYLDSSLKGPTRTVFDQEPKKRDAAQGKTASETNLMVALENTPGNLFSKAKAERLIAEAKKLEQDSRFEEGLDPKRTKGLLIDHPYLKVVTLYRDAHRLDPTRPEPRLFIASYQYRDQIGVKEARRHVVMALWSGSTNLGTAVELLRQDKKIRDPYKVVAGVLRARPHDFQDPKDVTALEALAETYAARGDKRKAAQFAEVRANLGGFKDAGAETAFRTKAAGWALDARDPVRAVRVYQGNRDNHDFFNEKPDPRNPTARRVLALRKDPKEWLAAARYQLKRGDFEGATDILPFAKSAHAGKPFGDHLFIAFEEGETLPEITRLKDEIQKARGGLEKRFKDRLARLERRAKTERGPRLRRTLRRLAAYQEVDRRLRVLKGAKGIKEGALDPFKNRASENMLAGLEYQNQALIDRGTEQFTDVMRYAAVASRQQATGRRVAAEYRMAPRFFGLLDLSPENPEVAPYVAPKGYKTGAKLIGDREANLGTMRKWPLFKTYQELKSSQNPEDRRLATRVEATFKDLRGAPEGQLFGDTFETLRAETARLGGLYGDDATDAFFTRVALNEQEKNQNNEGYKGRTELAAVQKTLLDAHRNLTVLQKIKNPSSLDPGQVEDYRRSLLARAVHYQKSLQEEETRVAKLEERDRPSLTATHKHTFPVYDKSWVGPRTKEVRVERTRVGRIVADIGGFKPGDKESLPRLINLSGQVAGLEEARLRFLLRRQIEALGGSDPTSKKVTNSLNATLGNITGGVSLTERLERYSTLLERIDNGALEITIAQRTELLEAQKTEVHKAERVFVAPSKVLAFFRGEEGPGYSHSHASVIDRYGRAKKLLDEGQRDVEEAHAQLVAAPKESDAYKVAQKLLERGQGRLTEARTLVSDIEQASITPKLEEQFKGAERVNTGVAVGIVVASGFVGGVGMAAVRPLAQMALGARAGAVVAHGTNAALFYGTNTALSAAHAGDRRLIYDSSKGLGSETFRHARGVVFTAGMFGTIGLTGRLFMRRAHWQLMRLAAKRAGASTGPAFQTEYAMLARSLAVRAGMKVGSFASELLTFGGYGFVQGTAEVAITEGRFTPGEVASRTIFSLDHWKHEAGFLLALKAGNVIASPITKPLHKMASDAVLAPYRRTISQYESGIRAYQRKFQTYLETGKGEPLEIIAEGRTALKQQRALMDRITDLRKPQTDARNRYLLEATGAQESFFRAEAVLRSNKVKIDGQNLGQFSSAEDGLALVRGLRDVPGCTVRVAGNGVVEVDIPTAPRERVSVKLFPRGALSDADIATMQRAAKAGPAQPARKTARRPTPTAVRGVAGRVRDRVFGPVLTPARAAYASALVAVGLASTGHTAETGTRVVESANSVAAGLATPEGVAAVGIVGALTYVALRVRRAIMARRTTEEATAPQPQPAPATTPRGTPGTKPTGKGVFADLLASVGFKEGTDAASQTRSRAPGPQPQTPQPQAKAPTLREVPPPVPLDAAPVSPPIFQRYFREAAEARNTAKTPPPIPLELRRVTAADAAKLPKLPASQIAIKARAEKATPLEIPAGQASKEVLQVPGGLYVEVDFKPNPNGLYQVSQTIPGRLVVVKYADGLNPHYVTTKGISVSPGDQIIVVGKGGEVKVYDFKLRTDGDEAVTRKTSGKSETTRVLGRKKTAREGRVSEPSVEEPTAPKSVGVRRGLTARQLRKVERQARDITDSYNDSGRMTTARAYAKDGGEWGDKTRKFQRSLKALKLHMVKYDRFSRVYETSKDPAFKREMDRIMGEEISPLVREIRGSWFYKMIEAHGGVVRRAGIKVGGLQMALLGLQHAARLSGKPARDQISFTVKETPPEKLQRRADQDFEGTNPRELISIEVTVATPKDADLVSKTVREPGLYKPGEGVAVRIRVKSTGKEIVIEPTPVLVRPSTRRTSTPPPLPAGMVAKRAFEVAGGRLQEFGEGVTDVAISGSRLDKLTVNKTGDGAYALSHDGAPRDVIICSADGGNARYVDGLNAAPIGSNDRVVLVGGRGDDGSYPTSVYKPNFKRQSTGGMEGVQPQAVASPPSRMPPPSPTTPPAARAPTAAKAPAASGGNGRERAAKSTTPLRPVGSEGAESTEGVVGAMEEGVTAVHGGGGRAARSTLPLLLLAPLAGLGLFGIPGGFGRGGRRKPGGTKGKETGFDGAEPTKSAKKASPEKNAEPAVTKPAEPAAKDTTTPKVKVENGRAETDAVRERQVADRRAQLVAENVKPEPSAHPPQFDQAHGAAGQEKAG